MNQINNIIKKLNESLKLMSSESSIQIQRTVIPTCDILNDFIDILEDNSSEIDKLSDDFYNDVIELRNYIESLEIDIDNIDESEFLNSDIWDKLRHDAKTIINIHLKYLQDKIN